MCAKCSSLVVDDRHVSCWQDRRNRHQAPADQAAEPLVRAILAEAEEERDPMLRGIEEGRGGGGGDQGTPAPDDDAG